MLTLYNTAHEKICALTNYSDLYVEQAVSNTTSAESIALDRLHFKYPLEDGNNAQIQYECYIATDTDEYIVKEINKQTSDSITWVEYVCDLNIEPLKGMLIDNFAPGNVTADAAGNLALVGTGWTVGYCDVTKTRAAAKKQCTVFEALEDIAKAYSAEITFDTRNKKVNIHVKLGADRGAYFAEQLNLKQLQIQGNTRSYCTRLYPIGKDGLTIDSVNAGVKYVSNYQYSTKVVSAYWIDNRYTSAADLMADAQERLDYLSKPLNAYSANIIDLANVSDEWELLDFSLGDTITLIAESTGTHEQQRIVKIDRYIDEPEKTTCEIANRIASLDDIVLRVSDAADTVSNITDSTGAVQGNNVQITGTDGTYSTLNAAIANIGTLIATKANITDLTATIGRIETLESNSVTTNFLTSNYITADSIQSSYAKIDFANVANGTITNALIANGTITGAKIANATIGTAQIADAAITTALINKGAVNTAQIADGSITDAKIVDLTANKITAGTLSVDRLVITGSNKSIVYTINNANGTAQLSQSTIDGGSLTQRSITADRIVAKAITANEIASKTIIGNNIASNTITADNIKAGTITADRLDVNGLVRALNVSTDVLYAQKLTTQGSEIYGVIGTFADKFYSNSTSIIDMTGFVLKDSDGNDIYRIAAGKYGDDEFYSSYMKTAGDLVLQCTYGNNYENEGSYIRLVGDEIEINASNGTTSDDNWIQLQSGNNSQIFALNHDMTPLISVDYLGRMSMKSSAYPQIYGNGTVLQLSYSGTTGGEGLVIESSACRPANGGYPLGSASHRWGQITSTNSVISTSDRNLKNTIVTIPTEKATDFIMALNPVTYKFNDGTSGRTHWGMVAQDVKSGMNNLGLTNLDFAGYCEDRLEDESTICSLRYEEFIAPIITVEQNHERRIEALEQAIAEKAA